MKSISIYAVTRNQNIGQLQKLERQLSGREYFLKMRTWELESMKSLVRELEAHMDEVYALRFFYSFQIPRLGKEFDLLVYFLQNQNVILPKTQIFDRLWGFDSDTTISVVEVYVSKIRNKLKGTDFVESLQTLRSVGYILKDANQN